MLLLKTLDNLRLMYETTQTWSIMIGDGKGKLMMYEVRRNFFKKNKILKFN